MVAGCDRHRPRSRQPRHGLHGRDVQRGEGRGSPPPLFSTRRAGLNRKGTQSPRAGLAKIRTGRLTSAATKTTASPSSSLPRAKATASVLVFEDLKHIRERVKVRGRQRAKHSGWAFFHSRRSRSTRLARRCAGGPHRPPQHQPHLCSACGHCEKANRKSQGGAGLQALRIFLNADRERRSKHSSWQGGRQRPRW